MMPKLMELNGAVGFPLALYEAHDDMVAYLAKYRTGVDIAQLAAGIASPDVKGTFDGLVIPRKLPAAERQWSMPSRPTTTRCAMARPALQKLYRRHLRKNRLDALVFPTVPRVALPANAEASSPENFGALIQNTDPGSNAGIPGLQLPIGPGRRPAGCRSAWNSTDRPAATASCSPSGSGGGRRSRAPACAQDEIDAFWTVSGLTQAGQCRRGARCRACRRCAAGRCAPSARSTAMPTRDLLVGQAFAHGPRHLLFARAQLPPTPLRGHRPPAAAVRCARCSAPMNAGSIRSSSAFLVIAKIPAPLAPRRSADRPTPACRRRRAGSCPSAARRAKSR